MTKLDDIVREFSIRVTVPSTMSGKVPEDIYSIENNIEQQIQALVKEVLGEQKAWDVSKKDFGFKDQGAYELRKEQIERAKKLGLWEEKE